MTVDPEILIKIASDMEKPRELFLKWRYIVNRYDRGRETKLGVIRATLGREKTTQDELRYQCRAHPDYVKYLEEWDDAEKKMVEAQVVFENLKCAWESNQSAVAYQREHMKRFGG